MNNDWLDYLKHGTGYGAKVRSHKYISKEFRNGKWHYYYYDRNGKRKENKIKNALSDFYGEDERENLRRVDEELEKLISENRDLYEKYHQATTDSIGYDNPNFDLTPSERKEMQDAYLKAKEEYDKSTAKIEEVRDKQSKAYKKYRSTMAYRDATGYQFKPHVWTDEFLLKRQR